ncbi:MAG TPA: class I SAM-dependent methyltransferase [Phycisphaerae bacterium]|nr:class I SAM-dependent methyltransferase [Phycisphaerae bacterium]
MTKRRGREWFDDESFWRDTYPFMFPQKRFADASDEIGRIRRLVKPAGKKALDLCCGPGRFAVSLARKGFTVTGVDKTAFLLRKAKALARAAGVRVEWVKSDMRDFVRPEGFDLVLSMFTSFGYFDDKEEDRLVLKNVLANLRAGGALLMELLGKERLARVLRATTSDVLPDGSMLVQRHKIFDDWTRIRNEWTLIRKGRARTYCFHQTIYSGQELRERLEAAGFVDVRLYGDLDGRAYGPDALRLVAVGRRPPAPRDRTGLQTRAPGRRRRNRA